MRWLAQFCPVTLRQINVCSGQTELCWFNVVNVSQINLIQAIYKLYNIQSPDWKHSQTTKVKNLVKTAVIQWLRQKIYNWNSDCNWHSLHSLLGFVWLVFRWFWSRVGFYIYSGWAWERCNERFKSKINSKAQSHFIFKYLMTGSIS